jgi:hypothetical protein
MYEREPRTCADYASLANEMAGPSDINFDT